ncbi:MAG TPA: hypothetical protein VLB84_07395 [Bacteroidia bacterium]|nr:hypothetical protein [Bacteroidia bacterium]
MKKYKNYSGNSGIALYEIEKHSIRILFTHSSSIYTYSDSLISKHHIDKMKKLAIAGKGLATYINQHPEVREHAIS